MPPRCARRLRLKALSQTQIAQNRCKITYMLRVGESLSALGNYVSGRSAVHFLASDRPWIRTGPKLFVTVAFSTLNIRKPRSLEPKARSRKLRSSHPLWSSCEGRAILDSRVERGTRLAVQIAEESEG